MKNVIISFVVFLAMVGTMIYSLGYLNKVCNDIAHKSDNLEEEISGDSWDKAMDTVNTLQKEWERQSKIIPLFVNHAEVDLLNNELLKLTQYVKCKNRDESLASTHVVKFYIDNIKSLQKVTIENLL